MVGPDDPLIDATPSGPLPETMQRSEEDAKREFAEFSARVDQEPLDRMPRQYAYYTRLAEVVESGARCLGSAVGAVLVQGDGGDFGRSRIQGTEDPGTPGAGVGSSRVLGTGYNGTPSGVTNCDEGGCGRCRTEDTGLRGRFYDICACVHAEQNVLTTAARFGVATATATLFTTVQPCFTCLKELMQAGINRIYFLDWWEGAAHRDYNWVLPQYEALVEAFRNQGYEFARLVLGDERLRERAVLGKQRRDSLPEARRQVNAQLASGPLPGR